MAMDTKVLEQRARYKVGDKVYVNGLEPATVTARYYRRSTRTIVYDIVGRYGPIPRIGEERLRERWTSMPGL
jgi:hypothetical protein